MNTIESIVTEDGQLGWQIKPTEKALQIRDAIHNTLVEEKACVDGDLMFVLASLVARWAALKFHISKQECENSGVEAPRDLAESLGLLAAEFVDRNFY